MIGIGMLPLTVEAQGGNDVMSTDAGQGDKGQLSVEELHAAWDAIEPDCDQAFTAARANRQVWDLVGGVPAWGLTVHGLDGHGTERIRDDVEADFSFLTRTFRRALELFIKGPAVGCVPVLDLTTAFGDACFTLGYYSAAFVTFNFGWVAAKRNGEPHWEGLCCASWQFIGAHAPKWEDNGGFGALATAYPHLAEELNACNDTMFGYVTTA